MILIQICNWFSHRSNVRSAMHVASQLSGGKPTVGDVPPAPAC